MNKKSNLPEKVCPVCKLPFTWRKKWKKDWDNVIYCSKRCQKKKKNISNNDIDSVNNQ